MNIDLLIEHMLPYFLKKADIVVCIRTMFQINPWKLLNLEEIVKVVEECSVVYCLAN